MLNSSASAHEVDVDFLTTLPVIEEYETFVETSPISYLTQGDSDVWELEADIYHISYDIPELFSVGDFDESTITWDNKDGIPVYSLISSGVVNGDKVSWDLGDITTERQRFKIDASGSQDGFGGLDFINPLVKYSIAKKHQEGGLLYMQTNEIYYRTHS